SMEEIYLEEVDEVMKNCRNGRIGKLLKGYRGVWQCLGIATPPRRLLTGSLERLHDDGLSTLWSDTAMAVLDRCFDVTPNYVGNLPI
ncbi:hypothetical protein J1N35_038420, partial [Gossypium stocksii]